MVSHAVESAKPRAKEEKVDKKKNTFSGKGKSDKKGKKDSGKDESDKKGGKKQKK